MVCRRVSHRLISIPLWQTRFTDWLIRTQCLYCVPTDIHCSCYTQTRGRTPDPKRVICSVNSNAMPPLTPAGLAKPNKRLFAANFPQTQFMCSYLQAISGMIPEKELAVAFVTAHLFSIVNVTIWYVHIICKCVYLVGVCAAIRRGRKTLLFNQWNTNTIWKNEKAEGY